MSLVERLKSQMSLPVIAAPLFIVSQPDLVIAQCTSGIVGSFPALNARPPELLDEWLTRIESELAQYRSAHPGAKVAPFAVNQIVHHSNDRLERDLEACVRHRVPLIITSLRAPNDVVAAVHGYGGAIFHDVISIRHAEKALEAGVDGLVLVCAGAGVLAAQALGADFAYIGTRFIATREAVASDRYKQTIVDSTAADIVYTPLFTGVAGNYLKKSIAAAGLDPDNLPTADKNSMNFGSNRPVKAWRDVWGAGQGVGNIDSVLPAADVVETMKREYAEARRRLMAI